MKPRLEAMTWQLIRGTAMLTFTAANAGQGNFCCVRQNLCRSISQDDFHHIRAHNFSILLHKAYAGLAVDEEIISPKVGKEVASLH
jgi:hypothetical protein